MVKRPIHRIHGDIITQEYDTLAEECIITIANDEEVVVRILASPNDLLDLAYGHIHSEGRGIVTSAEVDGISINVHGDIKPRPTDDLLTASCGACTIGDIPSPSNVVNSDAKITPMFQEIMNDMRQLQSNFSENGGVHCACLVDSHGKILLLREDIGRHNAVDKAIGAALRNDIIPSILCISSRIGWEIVAKAVRSNIGIIIAAGAISSAAEELARSSNLTLVGFAGNEKPVIIGSLSRIVHK